MRVVVHTAMVHLLCHIVVVFALPWAAPQAGQSFRRTLHLAARGDPCMDRNGVASLALFGVRPASVGDVRGLLCEIDALGKAAEDIEEESF